MIGRCPRIVVAGVQSGVGKTSLTLALVAAFRRRGLRVRTFKVGPDFLDPTYLEAASERPCYNLDSWMSGAEYVRELFVRTTHHADIAVVEGVMGLFDGAEDDSISGSTAEIARLLDAPVLLVVNAHGMARSIAAMAGGYNTLEQGVRIGGVIANHAGGESHRRILRQALAAANCPPLCGCVPRDAIPGLPSRHLGLVTADPTRIRAEVVDRCRDAAESHVSCDTILEIARHAPALTVKGMPESPATRVRERVRIALAWDEAFHFYYQDTLDTLQTFGAELIRFSPLRDRSVPRVCDGIYIGGGYPEEFAEALSRNHGMLSSIREFGDSGKPLYAECGGLMYLSEFIVDRTERRHPMAGLIPTGAKMLTKRKALGYETITLNHDTFLGPAGSAFRGHEFHYSELTHDPLAGSRWRAAYRCTRKRTGRKRREGYHRSNILASYVHLHLGNRPDAIDRFIHMCAESKQTIVACRCGKPREPKRNGHGFR